MAAAAILKKNSL